HAHARHAVHRRRPYGLTLELLAHEIKRARIGAVGVTNDYDRDLGARLSAQQTRAGETGHVARGTAVDRAHVVAGLDAGAGARRSVADTKHSQVKLTRHHETDVAAGEFRLAVDRANLVRLQKRAG